jgi:hypothetical protein
LTKRVGFGHADEMLYMFDAAFGCPPIELGTKDGEFSEKLINLIATFARDGYELHFYYPGVK